MAVAAEHQTRAVVLSDIHIGDNTPTCWYQRSVHEPYLLAVLKWIIDRRDMVREVILLGDIFDTWTYPPAKVPPTMSQIAAEHPRLLGPSGAFADLVRAFPGGVKLLLGNHDGTLGRADIDELNKSLGGNIGRGEAITFVDCPVLVLRAGFGGPRTAFTHGHHWCMFNAPDERSPWDRLPIGQFVSRAIAYQHRGLVQPSNVAKLARMGNPADRHGAAVRRYIVELVKRPWAGATDQLSRLLLGYICDVTGMPTNEPIHLPGNRGTATVDQAKAAYAHIFDQWRTAREGRQRDAARAALADKEPPWLAWFAQRVALQTDSELVVMGHTHVPVSGLTVSPVNYVNNGYLCVPVPDRRTSRMTFTMVDIPRAHAEQYKVVESSPVPLVVPVTRAEAPVVPMLASGEDFSCYVQITNHGSSPLRRSGKPRASGWWAAEPPAVIAPGARADIWLQDEDERLLGSFGEVTYQGAPGTRPLEFSFACPTYQSNVVSSPVPDYKTRTADETRTTPRAWRQWRDAEVDSDGHPLHTRFTVNGGIGVSAVRPTRRPSQCNRLVPAIPAPGRVPDTPDQRRAAENASYLALGQFLLEACRADRWRGEVLCAARLVTTIGAQPLLDPTTEPAPVSGLRLRNPPAHIVHGDTGEVFEVTHPLYGTFQYVLIQPNGSAAKPAHGGFLFLPAPGSPNVNLVSFNVARMDAKECSNAMHAEMQITNWIQKQSADFQRRIGWIVLENGSRTLARKPGPCNHCCDDLAHFLTILNGPGRNVAAARARMSWENHYKRDPDPCGLTTTRSGLQKMVNACWQLQAKDPVPGRPPRPDDPDWHDVPVSTR